MSDDERDALRKFNTVVKPLLQELMITTKQCLSEEASRKDLRGALIKAHNVMNKKSTMNTSLV